MFVANMERPSGFAMSSGPCDLAKRSVGAQAGGLASVSASLRGARGAIAAAEPRTACGVGHQAGRHFPGVAYRSGGGLRLSETPSRSSTAILYRRIAHVLGTGPA